MANSWFFLVSGAGPAAENMAWDEALLEHSSRLGCPVLRFYGWSDPAATFGYFQKFADISAWTPLRPLIRRPTGGGLVPHDRDWTYSLTFPETHFWHQYSAVQSYQQVHEWVQRSFAEMKVATSLAPCCQKEAPGQCFIGAEKFDLLAGGRKIAGAAQRRNRMGLLIQGSVQPPKGAGERGQWERAMLKTAPAKEWEPLEPDNALRSRVAQLAAEKYSQDAYNQKR